MFDDVAFPLYVFLKDDWSMFLVESPDTVFRHIEQFYFENDEYLFWDAQGRDVRLTLDCGTLVNIQVAHNEITVREAFVRYSKALGVAVDATGTLAEVWSRLQANVKPQTRLHRIAGNIMGSGCLLVVLAIVVLFLALVGGTIKAIFSR